MTASMTATSEYTEESYVRVLGPVALVVPGISESPFSQTQRRILARLALSAPRPVSLDELIGAVWKDGQPASARQAILNQISRIRQTVSGDLISTRGDGYELAVETDAKRLLDGATAAEHLVASGDAAAAFDLADRALALWMGEPLTEINHVVGVSAFQRAALAAFTAVENTRVEAALLLGRRAWALAETERLFAMSPLDERRAANYARALAMNGRRGDALAAIARIRRSLRTELGIESGPDVAAAEVDILHGAAVGVGMVPRAAAPALVGRDAELREILRGVAKRQPVRVRGEPGSGVSRMLFEARTRLIALGVTVVLVRADEHPSSAVSLIEEILKEIEVPVVQAHSALSTFDAAVNAVEAARPMALIVDDVHFLGPSTWRAIKAAAAADYVGVVLGGHRRSVALPDEVEVFLGAMEDGAVAAIARARGVADPDDVAWLTEHSGGNPSAVQALADMVASGSAMTDFASATPAVTSLVGRLIGHLDADRRGDLELAAVAGDGYPVEALAHVVWPHPPAPPDDLVESASDGTLRFRHGAVQALIHQGLPRGLVSDLHHALGIAARQANAAPATTARHLLAAADLDPDAAIHSACEAARAATALGAHADAAEWLARALVVDTGSDPARTIVISIEHADELRLSGDPSHLDALLSAARQALDLGDDTIIAAAGFALLQLGGSSPAGDVDVQTTAVARQMLDAITDPEQRAVVQAAASLAWSMTGNAEASRQHFDEAEAVAVSLSARLRVLPFAYLALGRPVDLPRRTALTTELVEASRAADMPVPLWEGLHLQFSVELQYGNGAGARECLHEMESLIDRVGDVGRRWSTLYSAATIAHLDGDLERSEALARQAHAMFAPVSATRADAAYYAQLLPLRIEQDRLDELRPVAEALVIQQPGVTAWHAVLALVLAASGDHADSVRAGEHAWSALNLAQDDFTWLAAHVVGGRAAALVGDGPLAARYAERLEPWSELVCWQGTCSYGPVATVLADLQHILGDESAARIHSARARQLTASLAAPSDL